MSKNEKTGSTFCLFTILTESFCSLPLTLLLVTFVTQKSFKSKLFQNKTKKCLTMSQKKNWMNSCCTIDQNAFQYCLLLVVNFNQRVQSNFSHLVVKSKFSHTHFTIQICFSCWITSRLWMKTVVSNCSRHFLSLFEQLFEK